MDSTNINTPPTSQEHIPDDARELANFLPFITKITHLTIGTMLFDLADHNRVLSSLLESDTLEKFRSLLAMRPPISSIEELSTNFHKIIDAHSSSVQYNKLPSSTYLPPEPYTLYFHIMLLHQVMVEDIYDLLLQEKLQSLNDQLASLRSDYNELRKSIAELKAKAANAIILKNKQREILPIRQEKALLDSQIYKVLCAIELSKSGKCIEIQLHIDETGAQSREFSPKAQKRIRAINSLLTRKKASQTINVECSSSVIKRIAEYKTLLQNIISFIFPDKPSVHMSYIGSNILQHTATKVPPNAPNIRNTQPKACEFRFNTTNVQSDAIMSENTPNDRQTTKLTIAQSSKQSVANHQLSIQSDIKIDEEKTTTETSLNTPDIQNTQPKAHELLATTIDVTVPSGADISNTSPNGAQNTGIMIDSTSEQSVANHQLSIQSDIEIDDYEVEIEEKLSKSELSNAKMEQKSIPYKTPC